eukprot:Blabericola_migrator_1__12821@NODE_828_length_6363_cov_61_035419_g585_i0_p1_GENE_NODE_828_length_6363_cov_61_035419_g585_i0NODE_828_length_6363_cov_61_035419_g585_i0_p1_ORF_typecomplete_len882_score173_01_NODE_828_length_6363_cov_61_035419_g585_i032445889
MYRPRPHPDAIRNLFVQRPQIATWSTVTKEAFMATMLFQQASDALGVKKDHRERTAQAGNAVVEPTPGSSGIESGKPGPDLKSMGDKSVKAVDRDKDNSSNDLTEDAKKQTESSKATQLRIREKNEVPVAKPPVKPPPSKDGEAPSANKAELAKGADKAKAVSKQPSGPRPKWKWPPESKSIQYYTEEAGKARREWAALYAEASRPNETPKAQRSIPKRRNLYLELWDAWDNWLHSIERVSRPKKPLIGDEVVDLREADVSSDETESSIPGESARKAGSFEELSELGDDEDAGARLKAQLGKRRQERRESERTTSPRSRQAKRGALALKKLRQRRRDTSSSSSSLEGDRVRLRPTAGRSRRVEREMFEDEPATRKTSKRRTADGVMKKQRVLKKESSTTKAIPPKSKAKEDSEKEEGSPRRKGASKREEQTGGDSPRDDSPRRREELRRKGEESRSTNEEAVEESRKMVTEKSKELEKRAAPRESVKLKARTGMPASKKKAKEADLQDDEAHLKSISDTVATKSLVKATPVKEEPASVENEMQQILDMAKAIHTKVKKQTKSTLAPSGVVVKSAPAADIIPPPIIVKIPDIPFDDHDSRSRIEPSLKNEATKSAMSKESPKVVTKTDFKADAKTNTQPDPKAADLNTSQAVKREVHSKATQTAANPAKVIEEGSKKKKKKDKSKDKDRAAGKRIDEVKAKSGKADDIAAKSAEKVNKDAKKIETKAATKGDKKKNQSATNIEKTKESKVGSERTTGKGDIRSTEKNNQTVKHEKDGHKEAARSVTKSTADMSKSVTKQGLGKHTDTPGSSTKAPAKTKKGGGDSGGPKGPKKGKEKAGSKDPSKKLVKSKASKGDSSGDKAKIKEGPKGAVKGKPKNVRKK